MSCPDKTMEYAELAPEEIALDGVRYADLPQAGQIWRMGSVNPRWREELPLSSFSPNQEEICSLAARGVWLGQGKAPQTAVVCCGLGSAWPHMGRELYDNFPAARVGMERIAAAADWDLLALMDEPDVEKISHTRWQQPYLFMLEYAQWSQLVSLGFEPSLLCGHSMGEIIALCFAGIYSPEVAWYILDTRAMHMAEMEAKSTRENGMMAVHARADVIAQVLEAWPGLCVSNYNSPRQFIISGPRDALAQARKNLRKQRIPAILLNVNLAYHHPGMRILRGLSLRRLNALPMQAPRINVLSNVTADFYSQDQPTICRHMADLDENPVRWTECVHSMSKKYGITCFLELGAQDTLCSLITDNEEQANCMPIGRKGHETEQMRQACARLYALGSLPRKAIYAARQSQKYSDLPKTLPPPATTPKPIHGETPRFSKYMPLLANILGAAAGCPQDKIKPETDLRYDLSLRSSRFPLLIQEIEQATGISLLFENLLGVTCVGDLALAICAAENGAAPEEKEKNKPPTHTQAEGMPSNPKKQRFVEMPEVSSLVFLNEDPDPSAVALTGACHFSHFADPALTAHIVRHLSGMADIPCLPVSRAMQALIEGACLLFPDLAGHGLSDIRFFDNPLLPQGVTREGSLRIKKQVQFAHDGLMTQMCRAQLQIQNITGNGRRTGACTEIINGTVHMTASPYATQPLWPTQRPCGGRVPDSLPQAFYNVEGLGDPWRLLAGYEKLSEGMYRATYQDEKSSAWSCPGQNFTDNENIAPREKSRYNKILYIVEGIIQAALLAIVGEITGETISSEKIPAVLLPWRLSAVGFVIFNTLMPEPGAKDIQIRKTWDDGMTLRFDAQATDLKGRALVTLHHLEFLREPSTVGAGTKI